MRSKSNSIRRVTVHVRNRSGLHARFAAELVKVTNRFRSKIEIVKAGEKVDGKSIMEILTLAAGYETELEFLVVGDDAESAVHSIERFFSTDSVGEEQVF